MKLDSKSILYSTERESLGQAKLTKCNLPFRILLSLESFDLHFEELSTYNFVKDIEERNIKEVGAMYQKLLFYVFND